MNPCSEQCLPFHGGESGERNVRISLKIGGQCRVALKAQHITLGGRSVVALDAVESHKVN